MSQPQNTSPRISVILPVFNAARFLGDSIRSVLDQTFLDFELIIINDGSTDASADIISRFSDPRIISLSQPNMGLAATLNKGVSMARGELIARQDNDDISLPLRLQSQFVRMIREPSLVLLGTAATIIDEAGKPTGRYHDHPTEPAELKYRLLFDNPFVHSSVIFRKPAFLKAGGYSTDEGIFEDYELWTKLADTGRVANLEGRLLQYREVSTGMSKSAAAYGEKVRRQSFRNIVAACPGIDEVAVERFSAALHHTMAGELSREMIPDSEAVLDEIATRYARQAALPLQVVRQWSLEIQKVIRRHYLNDVISSETAGKLKKILARIERKILFGAGQ
jgi:GT2 family glycosyltransferase